MTQTLLVRINKTFELNVFELRLKHTHCFSSSFVCSLSWCVDNLNGFHRNITAITNLMCVSSHGATVCSTSKMNTDSLIEKLCQYCFGAVRTISLEYKEIFPLLRKSWRRHVSFLLVFITLMSDSGCSSALTEKFPVSCFRPEPYNSCSSRWGGSGSILLLFLGDHSYHSDDHNKSRQSSYQSKASSADSTCLLSICCVFSWCTL